jgi:hypothetical protein
MWITLLGRNTGRALNLNFNMVDAQRSARCPA